MDFVVAILNSQEMTAQVRNFKGIFLSDRTDCPVSK